MFFCKKNTGRCELQVPKELEEAERASRRLRLMGAPSCPRAAKIGAQACHGTGCSGQRSTPVRRTCVSFSAARAVKVSSSMLSSVRDVIGLLSSCHQTGEESGLDCFSFDFKAAA